jgi:uridine phosphorylase
MSNLMQRDIHITAKDLLNSLQFKEEDFGKIALVSGQVQRAEACLNYLENPIKNFSFLGYTFWTGYYKGKKVTVGNGGFFSPDSAFITEMLCVGGVDILIRLGSCGALREDIDIGDFIIVDKVIRGEGTTRYYVDDNFIPYIDKEITENLFQHFSKKAKVYQGGVWTTDALLRETKEIVNSYIQKGAICVDMVTSPFVTIANLYQKKVACVLVVSDNLMTGKLGFTELAFLDAQEKMVEIVFGFIEDYV